MKREMGSRCFALYLLESSLSEGVWNWVVAMNNGKRQKRRLRADFSVRWNCIWGLYKPSATANINKACFIYTVLLEDLRKWGLTQKQCSVFVMQSWLKAKLTSWVAHAFEKYNKKLQWSSDSGGQGICKLPPLPSDTLHRAFQITWSAHLDINGLSSDWIH